MNQRNLLAPVALLALGLFACSPSNEADPEPAEAAEELTTTNPGATQLLTAVRAQTDHAKFLGCKTAPGVSPRFEISWYGMGAVPVMIRTYSGPTGVAREWWTSGNLEGIPRAGDLQGTVDLKIGSETVGFDYYAEDITDESTLVFHGKSIPLRCTVFYAHAQ
jgi:hypothetical protein